MTLHTNSLFQVVEVPSAFVCACKPALCDHHVGWGSRQTDECARSDTNRAESPIVVKSTHATVS